MIEKIDLYYWAVVGFLVGTVVTSIMYIITFYDMITELELFIGISLVIVLLLVAGIVATVTIKFGGKEEEDE